MHYWPTLATHFSFSYGNVLGVFFQPIIFYIQSPENSIYTTAFDKPVIEYWLERKRKEGNVLFNDALNTFYLRLYGVTHMVKYEF